MVLALEFEKLQIRQERNNRGGVASVEHVWSGSISYGHTTVVDRLDHDFEHIKRARQSDR